MEITSFNPRTIEIFNKRGFGLYGNKEKLERHLTEVADTLPHTKRREEDVAKASRVYDVELGVEHIEHLLREPGNGGLNYIWEKGTIDKDLSPPAARTVYAMTASHPRTIEVFSKKGSCLYIDKGEVARHPTKLLILDSRFIELLLSVLEMVLRPVPISCTRGMISLRISRSL